MASQTAATTLRALKGAPLSVMIALIIARVEARPAVSEQWLMMETDWSQNKVRSALAYLVETGAVVRSKRYEGWRLSDGWQQLPLMAELVTIAGGDLSAGGAHYESESQNLTLPVSTTTTSIGGGGLTEGKAAAAEARESQKLTLAALHAAGIMGSTAEKLAKMEHITPAYVAGHAKIAKCQGKSIGLLVTRLRAGDPLSECEEEREVSKYISGPLAQFVNY